MHIHQWAGIGLGLSIGVSAHAAVHNLAEDATGFGLLPVVTLNQGTPAGLADGRMFDWFGPVTSPRNFADVTSLQPYMTWSTAQTVQAFRLWQDAAGSTWDRVRIDTLNGTDPTVESNWVNQYDSGAGLTGIDRQFHEVLLSSAVTTRGVRVRVNTTTTDIDVGEVNVFGPQLDKLSVFRVFPDSIAASSSIHRPPTEAVNVPADTANWFNSWLSNTAANNPGTDFTFDKFFDPSDYQSLNALAITWSEQAGFADLPAAWEILVDTGSGLTSLLTDSVETAQNGAERGQYYYDLTRLRNVRQIRLRVAEADVTPGLGISMIEFEAFNIPEPASLALAGAGAALLLARRRKA